jgi:tRNA pseudouridine38-40 synthase
VEQAAKNKVAADMADNEGSSRGNGDRNGDRKRKWEDRGGRRGGRGGRPLQHGSRPDKKRNMGRKEHK